MCFICNSSYDSNITELIICSNVLEIPDLLELEILIFCPNSQVRYIPNTLINLEILDCSNSQIKYIPKELINLIQLNCNNCPIEYIPDTLINLEILQCSNTQITYIPKELEYLQILDCNNIKYIPIRLTLLQYLQYKGQLYNKFEIKQFVNKLYISYRLNYLYKWNKYKNILWNIAEYYMAQKYSPNNIICNW